LDRKWIDGTPGQTSQRTAPKESIVRLEDGAELMLEVLAPGGPD
jgi:hypothetical protein